MEVEGQDNLRPELDTQQQVEVEGQDNLQPEPDSLLRDSLPWDNLLRDIVLEDNKPQDM